MDKPRLSVSVRELVEFSIHGEDLLPGSGLARMLEGGRAHRARQKNALEEGYRSEVPLSLVVAGETLDLQIAGRADALFSRGELLVVEEIKLTPFTEAPLTQALPEHLAQALCYGHMLCEENPDLPGVLLRVLYVHGSGGIHTAFETHRTREALAQGFGDLVLPMLAFQQQRLAHRRRRDASLVALRFPHPAYRAGQRQFSAQVYWAVHLQRRLLAQAPTGIGKTVATLYPTLKAMGEGKTEQIFYLTARTTGRALALSALMMLQARGAYAFVMELTAKDKICPHPERNCHPDDCPLARGFFLRLPEALEEMQQSLDWSGEHIRQVAQQHELCPFEFSLSLTELADVVVCDYNYAFDPGARLRRVFLFRRDMTLLVDEAHHLVERAREMFSADLDGAEVRAMRRAWGKQVGRKHPLYKAFTTLLRYLGGLKDTLEADEASQETQPEGLSEAALHCAQAMWEAEPLPGEGWLDLVMKLQGIVAVGQLYDETYVTLLKAGARDLSLRLFCLDPAPRLAEITGKLRGTIYFSATLSPLDGYARLLGLSEEDGKLALPSPFPREHLLVLKERVNTRYAYREESAGRIALEALALLSAHRGNYLMMFPSYAYLRQVQREIEQRAPRMRLLAQQGHMDEAAREFFLAQFVPGAESLLGLVVMGGVFAEGIDLPGDRLSGVIVVGLGLPQICQEREALRAYFDRTMGDGFAYAYRIPGLTKVVQAVGRVIRTPEDVGVVLLLDDRFFHGDVQALLPTHWWQQEARQVAEQAGRFWRENGHSDAGRQGPSDG